MGTRKDSRRKSVSGPSGCCWSTGLSTTSVSILVWTLGSLAAGEASGGVNSNGTLVLADLDRMGSCNEDPCLRNEVCFDFPESCDEVSAQIEKSRFSVWAGVYAAFPADASPVLYRLSFGLEYDEANVFVANTAACGSSTDDPNWPSSGSGTVVTLSEPETDRFILTSWIVAYEYYGVPSALSLVPHPGLGATFYDDSVPPVEDSIVALGSFGFSGTDGYVPCPDELGACCFPTECLLSQDAECDAAGGSFLGDGTSCEPDPCQATPVIGSSWGALKRTFR